MHKILIPAFAIFALSGCAGEGSTSGSASKETPLTRDEAIAIHTNTLIKATFSNGDRAENIFGTSNTVKATYMWSGGSETSEGTWTLKDDNSICFQWQRKNWDASCWVDYKVGDQYVSYEQGGKKRKVRFTVTPQS
jgi:hypothetical protein